MKKQRAFFDKILDVIDLKQVSVVTKEKDIEKLAKRYLKKITPKKDEESEDENSNSDSDSDDDNNSKNKNDLEGEDFENIEPVLYKECEAKYKSLRQKLKKLQKPEKSEKEKY